MVFKEVKEKMVALVQLDHLVLLVLMASLVHKEELVYLEVKDLLVPMDHQ